MTYPLQLIYGLRPAWWGQGFATVAARALLDYGSQTVGFADIVAAMYISNEASVRVMERLGMAHWQTNDTTLYYRLISHLSK